MEIKRLTHVLLVLLTLTFGSCKNYTANVILKVDEEDINWSAEYKKTLDEYSLRIGDKLQYSIYTNLGEAIIDPSGKLVSANNQPLDEGTGATGGKPVYEVSEAGTCFFPVIGKFIVADLKVSQLDSLLTTNYEKFYNEVYIISKVINKRVVVIGGKRSQVIPLENPNTNLLEIIALYGGFDNDSRGYNIRIVRGDLKNPEITVVNFRTVADMKNTIVQILPDDIIYIEPVRKPISESLRDNLRIFTIVNSLVSIILIIDRVL